MLIFVVGIRIVPLLVVAATIGAKVNLLYLTGPPLSNSKTSIGPSKICPRY
jgi:hypothetical protein